ncbi:HAD hydrolase family protein [Anaerocolumna jejuensis]|uniref:HAD hydrolase family protein n=1 Tax=Anaerocolumna jejuensis TaxID=259063 RepID=UPI003F7B86BD
MIYLQKQGIKIALASGRPTPGVTPLADELELKKYGGYLLSFNGAYISECSTGKIIFEEMLPHSAVKFIYLMAKAHHCGILTYENNEIITEMPENRYIQLEAAINKMKVKKVDSLVEYIDIPVPKFLIVQDGDYLAEVEKLMAASLGDSYNDITMLQYAGLGIAMENGRDIVRDTADFITLSNDEEGIVYAIEKILAGLI